MVTDMHLSVATVSAVARGLALGRRLVLAAAVVIAAWLILAPITNRSSRTGPATEAAAPLAKVWPAARQATSPGRLTDGADYAPVRYLTPDVSVGTAPTPDGGALRLLLREAGGATRELRRLAADQAPQFAAVTVDGDSVYWAESAATESGAARTAIWRAGWRTPAPAVLLVPDAGDATFFNSQHDLEVADGAVHWMAAGPVEQVATELRSAPVAGGAVTTRALPGAFALSAWPWLVSTGSGRSPVDLFNLANGERIRVPTSATETIVCGPVWCRVRVVASSGVSRLDLMRPDGSDRHRIAGGTVTASAPDVALLDRFEVLTSGSGGSRSVQLYDVKTRTTAQVTGGATTVVARDGALWWSTGARESAQWHVLDLTSLP
jgi:hypothetical protein